MLPIELVVFDMAGTTVQDRHEVEMCFIEAASHTGLSVTPERVLALQGYSKRYVFELLWTEVIGENNPDLQEFVDVSYAKFCHILENHYLQSEIYPTEGCLEIFSYLKSKNIKIALSTGFYRKVTDIILEKLGWLDGLDENYLGNENTIIQLSVASDEVLKGRPEPYMIHHAMKVLNVHDSFRVLNIGDTPSDLKSGIRAGCRMSLGVTNGTHTRPQLSIHRNDGLLSKISDLKQVIERIENENVIKENFDADLKKFKAMI
ncbi:phosphonatase-like hydrolase [Arcicella aurantiaca]|uniref:Phosphonatase-like hydrolase n=1 Tax=Arcicella aurantiaca TaxID=591202 RepID=A0A316EB66_9BACT|nr:HAD family hydrolase [Arcicella aurantiaca]PWK27685.1 phosphonatase-like hydrolase [Arcicella aurantiaca]